MSTRFIQGTPVNYQGRTDGTVAPTGQIGETITVTGTLTPVVANYVTTPALTVTAGVWSLYFRFDADSNGSTATALLGGISTSSTATTFSDISSTNRMQSAMNGSRGSLNFGPLNINVASSGTLLYYGKLICYGANFNAAGNFILQAIRIA